jgi:hypothetical protein
MLRMFHHNHHGAGNAARPARASLCAENFRRMLTSRPVACKSAVGSMLFVCGMGSVARMRITLAIGCESGREVRQDCFMMINPWPRKGLGRMKDSIGGEKQFA